MISTLLPYSADAVKWLGAAVLAVALMVAGDYVGDSLKPDRKPVPPDTIEKERTITRTDTVTETVPRTVIRYKQDTVRATDTVRVPVPADFEMMGVVPQQPLDIGSDEATLTYWTGDRWQQNVYGLPRDTWRLDLRAQGTALRDAAVASTSLQVRRRTTFGWLGVGPSYGAVVTTEATTGFGVTVSFTTTLWSN